MTAVLEREQVLLADEIARLRALLEAHRDGTEPPDAPQQVGTEPRGALARVARLFGLSPFERLVLLLAAAVELDGAAAALVAALQGGADPRPTFGLALSVLPDPHWDALAPHRPLRRARLLELGAGPTLATRPLRVDERVLHHLAGAGGPDERLDGIVRLAAPGASPAPTQAAIARQLAETIARAGDRALVELDGDDPDDLLAVADELAAALGRVPLLVRGDALPPPGPETSALARLIEREAALLDGLPVVDAGEHAAALLDELDAPVAVVLGRAPHVRGRIPLRRTVAPPPPGEARALWSAALAEPALDAAVEQAAEHFRLGAAAIDAVARELAAAGGDDRSRELVRLCRERSRVRLDHLARRIDPAATWDDLVLPPEHLEVLHELVRQVRNRTQVYERWGLGARTTRGLGITALFTGESGTGKTLAAEVIAGELGLDLYRIDLAATVSKYIGETEKNLDRIFGAAEAGGAVLLFDEADALFGRRGEVKDGHDRYANLEVAYLLQRMESYRGLAILTTNLRSNVDRAFLRRLRFVVAFPFPGPGERERIWRGIFPDATPVDGIEPADLARLVASGGAIRSMALAAAFAAADAGTPVTPAHVLRAAQLEYAKADRRPTSAETEALR